ncbi:MAG: ACP S-malonyltransferase [Nitrosomonas sp.]|nr:ACP S-malonyltransferase [Nitrosomonas sp.]
MNIACVFPGQGSQSIGMMNGYSDFPIIQQTFQEAADVLEQDFWSLVSSGAAEDINSTVNTQPLMLIAGVAVYRAWISSGGKKPALLAGHSLGEYTALVASEALSFADALKLVRFRAQAMQQAVPDGVGGMAAILGLEDSVVEEICHEVTSSSSGESLEAANFNSPGQIVIAGHKNAILLGIELAKSKGAKRALLLPMSIPSHCSLMQPAADRMRQQLESIPLQSPCVPILHNVDVKSHADDTAALKEILIQQLVSPVRWVATIQAFAASGITHVIECGPGKVLMGLNKRIEPQLHHSSLADSEAIKQTIGNLSAQ